MRFLTLLLSMALCLPPLSEPVQAQDWRLADRSSAGLAPSPESEHRAVVQVYAARAFRWRKYFAVHSWIATKEKNATSYKTYHVIGFRQSRGLDVVVVEDGVPDARWYGAEPDLLRYLRGEGAESAIPKIQAAALSYAYQKDYRVWPGPNSNSFISHILRHTPEIGVELPPHAIGKDWIGRASLVGLSETRSGVQFSLLGVLGFTVGLGDGVEVNLLGLSFGVDILRPALKLPFFGRLGFKDAAVFSELQEPESTVQ